MNKIKKAPYNITNFFKRLYSIFGKFGPAKFVTERYKKEKNLFNEKKLYAALGKDDGEMVLDVWNTLCEIADELSREDKIKIIFYEKQVSIINEELKRTQSQHCKTLKEFRELKNKMEEIKNG